MLTLKIAARYLFSRKSHKAINAITIVAACGIGLIAAALICVLSVYNGFEGIMGTLTSRIDPQLRIEATQGKAFTDDEATLSLISSHPGVQHVSRTLEETILIINNGRQVPARVKGVDSNYNQVTEIDSLLLFGDSLLLENDQQSYTALGVGLSMQVACKPGFLRPLQFFCPKREGKLNLANAEEAYIQQEIYCSDLFAVRQADYDDDLCLVSLETARRLTGNDCRLTAYELRLQPDASLPQVQQSLQELLPDFRVLTQQEQQADAYRIVSIEKWITYLLVLFILIIASFNIIGALSMLIIDKRDEIRTLRNLGATPTFVRRVFLWVGWLVTGLGGLIGIVVGIILCLLQQEYGLITLGDGSSMFIVDSYPVELRIPDVFWSLFAISLIGILLSIFIINFTKKQYEQQFLQAE